MAVQLSVALLFYVFDHVKCGSRTHCDRFLCQSVPFKMLVYSELWASNCQYTNLYKWFLSSMYSFLIAFMPIIWAFLMIYLKSQVMEHRPKTTHTYTWITKSSALALPHFQWAPIICLHLSRVVSLYNSSESSFALTHTRTHTYRSAKTYIQIWESERKQIVNRSLFKIYNVDTF